MGCEHIYMAGLNRSFLASFGLGEKLAFPKLQVLPGKGFTTPVYSILSPELTEQRMFHSGAKGEKREFAGVNIMLAAKCHPPTCLEAQPHKHVSAKIRIDGEKPGPR